MREIKFRAWDKKNKRMIGWHDTVFKPEIGNSVYLCEYPLKYMKESFLEYLQFTGLKDKNKKEIYQGDILIINEEDDEWYDVVIRDKNCLELSKYKNRCVTNISLYEFHKKIKVIGNIYDNPEFLKKISNG